MNIFKRRHHRGYETPADIRLAQDILAREKAGQVVPAAEKALVVAMLRANVANSPRYRDLTYDPFTLKSRLF